MFPLKHDIVYKGHTIDWQVIAFAPHQQNKRKILETYYITKFKPSLNNQLEIITYIILEIVLRKYTRVIHI